MPLPAALQRFVDDELSRMPALIEQVRRQTVDALRGPAEAAQSPGQRMLRFDLAQALEQQARRFCDAFVDALSTRVNSEKPGSDDTVPPGQPPRGLALVDDAAHSADIEIARCASLIASAAEWELRELQTFTSALRALPYVSVNANPLRPDAFALALWQASDAVPQARNSPLLLRTAAGPLAEALRLEFAASCTRLEAQGVQPSLYRTAVPSQVERASVLADLLDTAPASAKPGSRAAPPRAGQATAELLTRLFETIAHAGQMQPALRALTGLVQTLAIDLASRDAHLLDNAGHPLWLMLDRFAYESATHPNAADPQLQAWVGMAAEQVAGIQALPLHDSEAWRAAVDQLDAYGAAQFNTQLQQAAGDIETLRRSDTGHAGLDIAAMDTVPADLLDGNLPADADRAAAEWLDGQAVATWYRLFLRGRWTVMRLLWHSESRARWLFAGPHPQRNDAFNRDTLVRLRAEKLIRPFVERSVVVRAAESLRRRLSDRRTPG